MELHERIIKKAKEKKSEWHEARVGFYHASQIYDICSGKLKPGDFFKQPVFDDTTHLIFALGKMYHELAQSSYEPDEIEIEIKIDLGDGAKIVGRVDALPKDKNVPIEFKSCSKLPTKPSVAHEYQVQCYIQALKTEFGWLSYLEKGGKINLPSRNFKILKDDSLFKDISEKVVQFHKELEKVAKN